MLTEEKVKFVDEIANVLFSTKLSLQTLEVLIEDSGDIFSDSEKKLLDDVSIMLKNKSRSKEVKMQGHLWL